MLARDWQTSPSRTILSGLKKGRKGKGKKVCGATKAEILPSFKPEFFYRDSSSGCIAKGYSTIAWTPFFLKITIRCTWPLGALIVCSTSCNTENKEGRFWQMSQIRYWKDADSIVAWNMQWQGYLRLLAHPSSLILEFQLGTVTINCMCLFISLYIDIATMLPSSPEEFAIRQQVGIFL